MLVQKKRFLYLDDTIAIEHHGNCYHLLMSLLHFLYFYKGLPYNTPVELWIQKNSSEFDTYLLCKTDFGHVCLANLFLCGIRWTNRPSIFMQLDFGRIIYFLKKNVN